MRIKFSHLIVCSLIASLMGCNSSAPAPAPAAQPMPSMATPPVKPIQPAMPTTKPGVSTFRPATIPGAAAITTLKFNAASIDAIEAGTKTSTTRKGVRKFAGKIITATGGDTPIKLEILSAIPKKMSDLTEADARSDGSENLDAMKTTLMSNYDGITPDDVVTVITFRVAK